MGPHDSTNPRHELVIARQLNYSWLRSLSRSYAPFWEITADALDYAMEALGLSDPDMREALLHLYRELAPYEDATIALEAVADQNRQ